MKIFVTGGNGFIGSVVVRELIAQGHSVRLLLRKTSKTHRLAGLTYESCIGDVRESGTLDVSGCEGIIHLASLSAWADIHSPQMKGVVLDGTRNVLEAAKRGGNLRTVFVSSITAIAASIEPHVFNEAANFDFEDAGLTYSQFKRDAEKLCTDAAAQGLPVMIVNPGEVYGPHDDDMITAKNLIDFAKSWPVMVCKGGTLVAHVDDVARGVIAALLKGRPGERYILGGENVSIRQLADLSGDILGKKKWTVTFPNGFIKALTKAATAVHLPLPYEPAVIPYATRYWYMDNTKAKTELGVTFRSARASLEPTIAWLKMSGHI